MRKTLRILPVLVVAALLAGCEGPCKKIDTISGPTLSGGSADFTTVAAVGTSISSGYQSGGLVSRHQIHSFPALFAQQTGHSLLIDGNGSFTFNGISQDGIPALTKIQSLSPLVISNAGQTLGAPANGSQPTAYHNLAIPGQLAVDLVDSTYYTADPNPVRGSGYNKTFFNLIYRTSFFHQLGIQQLLSKQPTFVLYEFGANEVLGAASQGNANVFPPASYITAMQAGLGALHATLPNTKVAIFTIPDVTSIPFCTTFPPVTRSKLTGTPIPLLGPGNAQLAPGDLVLLTAGPLLATGQGFSSDGYNYVNPAANGTGAGLPDAVVLSEAEQATIATATSTMNDALRAYVAANPSWTVLVDLNALLADINDHGYRIGATTYTSAFVTGGLFSLDGVHPNDLAHAIVCNTLIDAVNAKWGSTVPKLNLSQYATVSASRAQPATDEPTYPLVQGLDQALSPLWLKH